MAYIQDVIYMLFVLGQRSATDRDPLPADGAGED